MRTITFTFDPVQLLWAVAVVLLIVGVIHFTPVAVGALLLGSQCHLTWTWKV